LGGWERGKPAAGGIWEGGLGILQKLLGAQDATSGGKPDCDESWRVSLKVSRDRRVGKFVKEEGGGPNPEARGRTKN